MPCMYSRCRREHRRAGDLRHRTADSPGVCPAATCRERGVMKRGSARWFVAALMSTVVAVVDHSARPAAQTPASGGANPSMVFDTVTKQKIRVVAVASGLMHPWSIAFLPDGHKMLVADPRGQLRVVRDGVLDPT